MIFAAVPTLGGSPHLLEAVLALRREGLSVVLVHQGARAVPPEAESLAQKVIRVPRNLGFATATNLALDQARGEYVATVNDDAVVQEGWLPALLSCLEENPGAAAVQGANLKLDSPSLCDGCGLAWNRWWQAVQLRRNLAPPASSSSPTEIFGVSATAALYRREALLALGPVAEAFNHRLWSYYEDVELSIRLREVGALSFLVPAARVHHAGSVSGQEMPNRKLFFIYRNRCLVAASLLGRRFWVLLPRIWLRDAIDLWRCLVAGHLGKVVAIKGAWLAALPLLSRFAHLGPPRVRLDELRRLSAESWEPPP